MQRPVTLWGERQKVWDLEVLKTGGRREILLALKMGTRTEINLLERCVGEVLQDEKWAGE